MTLLSAILKQPFLWREGSNLGAVSLHCVLLFPLAKGGSLTKIIIKCCPKVTLFVLLRNISLFFWWSRDYRADGAESISVVEMTEENDREIIQESCASWLGIWHISTSPCLYLWYTLPAAMVERLNYKCTRREIRDVAQFSTASQKSFGGKTEASSGFVVVAAAYWHSKVQLHSRIARSLAIHLSWRTALPQTTRCQLGGENSGCPILWDDCCHGRPPLQHNADTFKRGFPHRTRLTMTRCSATQSNI